jgi:hypothetical protein
LVGKADASSYTATGTFSGQDVQPPEEIPWADFPPSAPGLESQACGHHRSSHHGPGSMGCDRPLGAGNEVVMNRPGHSVRILSITAYVIAGLLAAAGVIVGLLPRSVAGFDAVCPSVLGHLTGAVTPLQSVADRLASAPCVTYEDQMMALMGILLDSAAAVLIAGLIAGSRSRRLRSVPPPATGTTQAVAEPTHFPLSTRDQDAVAAPRGATDPGELR